jgi:hypothetical protein
VNIAKLPQGPGQLDRYILMDQSDMKGRGIMHGQTQRVAGMQAANGISPLQARLRAMRAAR